MIGQLLLFVVTLLVMFVLVGYFSVEAVDQIKRSKWGELFLTVVFLLYLLSAILMALEI